MENTPTGRSTKWAPETKLKARAWSKGTANALKLTGMTNMKSVASLFWKTPSAPKYTVEDLEKTVYDNKLLSSGRSCGRSRRLVTIEGLVSVDQDEKAPPYLIRTLTEWPGFLHGLVWITTSILSSVTFPVTFMWNGTWSDSGHYTGFGVSQLFYLDITFDVVYTLCVLMLLNMSYMNQVRRVEVVRRDRVLKDHVLSPWFWLRLASSTIYLWISIFDLPLMANNVKILRYYHIFRYPDSLWKLQDRWILILLKPILLLVLASHWMACLLIALGGYRDVLNDQGSQFFETSFDGNQVSGYFSLYLMAYVESLYMLTGSLDNPLGEGDGPRNKKFGSLVIVSIFGPIGCVITALLIAAIMRQHALKFALDMRHEENKEFIKRALQNLNIPADLQRRVFSLQYYQKMSHDQEALKLLFTKRNLSPPLESALRIYLYHDSVLHSTYFKDKDHNYILEVVKVLEDQIFLPGDFVTRRGEVDNRMFFVARGDLRVLVASADENNEVVPDVTKALEVGKILSKGDYFGEVALIQDCVRTAWVRADTYVLLSTLERAKIESIWKFYPEERNLLVQAVAMVSAQDRERRAAQLQKANARTFYSNPSTVDRQRTSVNGSLATSGSGADAAGGTPETNAPRERTVTFRSESFLSDLASSDGHDGKSIEASESMHHLKTMSAVSSTGTSVRRSRALSSEEELKRQLADCMTHTDGLIDMMESGDETSSKAQVALIEGLNSKLDEISARQSVFAQELSMQQSTLEVMMSKMFGLAKGSHWSLDKDFAPESASRDSDRLDEMISRQISLENLITRMLGMVNVDATAVGCRQSLPRRDDLDKCRKRNRRRGSCKSGSSCKSDKRTSNCSYGRRFSVQGYKREFPSMLPEVPSSRSFARKSSLMQMQFSDLPGSSWIFPSPVLPSTPQTLPMPPVTAWRDDLQRSSLCSSRHSSQLSTQSSEYASVQAGIAQKLLEFAQNILAQSQNSHQSSSACSSEVAEDPSPPRRRVLGEMLPGTDDHSDSESTICASECLPPSLDDVALSETTAPASCVLYETARLGLAPRRLPSPEPDTQMLLF